MEGEWSNPINPWPPLAETYLGMGRSNPSGSFHWDLHHAATPNGTRAQHRSTEK